jgi:signal transduction histidine kinase/CheY-like chemotaxis protein
VFLDQLTESIGIVLNTIEANMRTEDLLKQSQSLAKELGSRQEELQTTNQELQEKARLLAFQNVEVERKNSEVEQARQALEEKAEQLALTSKYKSEFLANMSHELRTPLNSLLILSDQLSKNPDGNLSPKQTEYAKTIHSSGNDLLMLINDILDLSKIESGTVVLDLGELRFTDLHNYVERTFRHVAETKGVEFEFQFDPELPSSIVTDSKRLQQVIKNLLSNAFKFTHRGRVCLNVDVAHRGWNSENENLNSAACVLAFSVSDTGIGIPAEKQQIIFEAFQQADGSTSRKYGGTGLGLAISREISRLLGGEIGLVSKQGSGSTFTLYLPQNFVPQKAARRSVTQRPPSHSLPTAKLQVHATTDVDALAAADFGDDRKDIQADDHVLLIVDNDLGFDRIALELARKAGFKAVVAPSGATALSLVGEYAPHAVLLDISLPDINGWRVLKRLKHDLTVRHIPVFVVSTIDHPERGLLMGAQGILPKPIQTEETLLQFMNQVRRYVEKTTRRVVLYTTEPECGLRFRQALEAPDVTITIVSDEAVAQSALCDQTVDLAVVASASSAQALQSLCEKVSANPSAAGIPILVLDESGGPLVTMPSKLSPNDPFKIVGSWGRLIDEAVSALCRPVTLLNESCRQIVYAESDPTSLLAGKKVLIVDDDIRNIFALTSILERYEMVTIAAETGRDAINLLQTATDIDIVLMDIMMPEMDGIDTMRVIRQVPELRNLPIVAVTAKAMKGDREKCIEAGAWDYLSKPIDSEQLLSVLRAWLTE